MKILITSLTIFTLIFFSNLSYSQINCESARKKYLELNPDVAKAKIDPWSHYTFYGKKEGRVWPNCAFTDPSRLEKSNQEISSMKLDYRYYCYTTLNGRYQLGLDDGGSHNVTYQLYNLYGSLMKTVVGKWTLQDEGVYGPAMILTISFTGKNAGLPSMKFNAQYDGFGNLQGVIDNQGRIWGACK